MWPFHRQKSRAERLREEVGTTLAAVGDRLDQAVESFRNRAPSARAEVRQTGRGLGRRAEDWRERTTERVETLRREARQSRLALGHLGERLAEGIGQHTGDGLITRMTRGPVSRVATLAAITAGVGQAVGRIPETVGEKISETPSRAGEAVSQAGARGVQRIKWWGFTNFCPCRANW